MADDRSILHAARRGKHPQFVPDGKGIWHLPFFTLPYLRSHSVSALTSEAHAGLRVLCEECELFAVLPSHSGKGLALLEKIPWRSHDLPPGLLWLLWESPVP